jgi:RIO kinase 1
MMLLRDVNNMTQYFGQYAPDLLVTHYGEEIWDLFEHGNLHPDVKLTGQFAQSNVEADLATMMRIIEHAKQEEEERKERERMARNGEF